MTRWPAFILLGFLMISSCLTVPVNGQTARPTASPEQLARDRAFLDETRSRLDKGDASGLADTLANFIAGHPGHPLIDSATYLLARARRAGGDTRGAVEALRSVVNDYLSSPERGPALYLLGRLYEEQRDETGAVASYEKASVLLTDPADRAECVSRAAALLARRGDPVRAVSLLVPALNDPAIAAIRPDLREQVVGILDGAGENDLERIAQSYPNRFPGNAALVHLAVGYQTSEDTFDETAVLRRLVGSFPEDPYMTIARKRLAALRDPVPPGRIAIGVVSPISGPMKAYGVAVTRGVRLAVERARRKGMSPIAIAGVDTAAAGGNAADEVAALVAKGRVVAVVGPLLSREMAWSAPIAKRYQVPFITASASADAAQVAGGFVFKDTISNERLAAAIANVAMERLGLKRFIIIYPNNAYGSGSAQAFAAAVKGKEGMVLGVEAFDPNEADFTELMERVKNRDAQWGGHYEAKSDPADDRPRPYKPGFDAVFIPAGAQKAGLIASQLAFFDLRECVLLGAGGWNDSDLLKIGGRYLENAVYVDGFFAESLQPAVREFVKTYRDAYGEVPSIFAAQGYDAAGMVLQAIERGARGGTPVRDALSTLKAYPGAAGRTTILPDGSVDRTLFFVQVRGGRLVPLETGGESP